MARILSVSYDSSLLATRQVILEAVGHEVVSACGFKEALEECERSGKFDLFILGHSIPRNHKQDLIVAFRSRCPAPVIALTRGDQVTVEGADFQIEPEPEELLSAVAQALPPEG